MDLQEIKRIIKMVESADITSLKLKQDDLTIEVSKEGATAPTTVIAQAPVAPAPVAAPVATPTAPAPAPDSPAAETPAGDGLTPITSPMVGTFYAAPNPDSPAFVKAGDSIQKGGVVCIVEAMKLFNEIESDVSGTIEKVLIENGQPVEFGQPLFLVRT